MVELKNVNLDSDNAYIDPALNEDGNVLTLTFMKDSSGTNTKT